jgi:hypothetical protein
MPEPKSCIANISQRERRKRLVNGLIALVAATLLLIVSFRLGISRWWRFVLFVPFWVSASGFFQWREQTCVRLAAQAMRQLGDKAEPIEEPGELAQVRQQARQVRAKTTVIAVILTLLALIVPE